MADVFVDGKLPGKSYVFIAYVNGRDRAPELAGQRGRGLAIAAAHVKNTACGVDAGKISGGERNFLSGRRRIIRLRFGDHRISITSSPSP